MRVFKTRILFASLLGMLMCVPGTLMAQDSTDVDVFEMDLEDLLNMMVVSASKKAESGFDAPLSLSAISKDEIRNSGATTIEELFRLIPGVIVREETNGNFDIHIRGNDNVPPGNFTFMSENSLSLVMVDGRKVYNQMNGGTFWESLPVAITDIERIEVIRGPSSALYGPNAVAGVINIITTRTNEEDGFSAHANVMAGNQNTTIVNATLGYKINKIDIRLSGNMDTRNRFEDTYYDYTLADYVIADSLHDFQNTSGTTVGSEWANAVHPQRDFSKEKMSANAYLRYSIDETDYIDLSAGMQSSEASTVFMETVTTPLSRRTSTTNFADVRASFKGFTPQVSYLSGVQNIYEGTSNLKYDLTTIDAGLEYEYETEKLVIRPGVIYQWSEYDDSEYRTSETSGLINGARELSNFGFTLRGDYKPTDKLRVIAALRGDKFQFPDDLYVTYQLIGSYKINDENLVRAVASRSNRGPFMADVHTNFASGGVLYQGNNGLNLPTMDMYEIGYRSRLNDMVQIDFEAFYSITDDFIGLEVDTVQINFATFGADFFFEFRNYNTTSEQIGATMTVDFAPSEKLRGKVFATIQQTTLDNFERDTIEMYEPLPGFIPAFPIPTTYEVSDVDFKGTPSVFGGFSLNYKPMEKLNVWTNAYFFAKQTYTYQSLYPYDSGNATFEVPAKFRLDLKVAYKVWKENALFFNARNLLNTSTSEFGMAEKIGGLYTFGLDIKL